VEVSSRADSRQIAGLCLVQVIWWLSVAALLAGIVFRFSDLGTKTLWADETYTLLRVSGYTERDLGRLTDGRPHSINAVRFFQRVHSAKSIRDTADSLASDEPQHPPLYFAAERLWMGAFGDSVVAVRSLSAFAGTLALLGMFWLASELFPRSNAGWTAAAIIAVSPFQVVYSHEAREYSAWAAITIIATATMLRAVRISDLRWWAIYAATVAIGCYTDVIFAYVVAAHGLTLLCLRSTRTFRTLAAFFAAATAGILAFAPWLVALIQHRSVLSGDMGWADNAMPFAIYVGKLAFNASTVFFDLTFLSLHYAIIAAVVLGVVVAALFVVARWAPALVKAVIFSLMVTTALPFIVEDALHHTYFATGSRYFVPFWIGLELALTYACAVYADRATLPRRWQTAWRSAFVAIVVLGVVSNVVGIGQVVWWDNHDDAASQLMADAVNASSAPPLLLIKPDNVPRLLVLSRYLRSDARFEVVTPALQPTGIASTPSLFVLGPHAFMLRIAAQATGCSFEPVPLQLTRTPADDLHASLAQYRGGPGDVLWRPTSACALPKPN
jgi:uncharacterized membrane protein